MVKKGNLNLAMALLTLLAIVCLIWEEKVHILYGLPLLVFVIVAITWIVRHEAKPARLLGFFVKTFTLFLIVTGAAYFIVWSGILASHTYTVYPIHAVFETGMVFILPISLFLEAASILIYGVYRIKLRAWEIFVSSWIVSTFVIFAVYAVWLFIYPPWKPDGVYYTSFAASVAPLLSIPFYSIFPAAVCTIVYMKYRKPQIPKST